jgi:hypothetical protein
MEAAGNPSQHFTYCSNPSFAELLQGDVIDRTEDVDRLLEEVHPHFFKHPKNLYFMVLTQSCDLVRRGPGTECKAPYITIAPVRALADVVRKHVAMYDIGGGNAALPVVTSKSKSTLSQFLHRLFNNNEPGYFYLDSKGTALTTDCCALLNLSIAIKAPLHFEKCLSAKRLQLDEAFQAKLGWLVGQMYSRVGTKDWEPSEISRKATQALEDAAITVPEDKLTTLHDAFSEAKSLDPKSVLTAIQIQQALKKAPNRKSRTLEQVEVILRGVIENEEELVEKIVRRLKNDPVITKILT